VFYSNCPHKTEALARHGLDEALVRARKSLRGSISQQSRQGLDWMNFFLADVQTAFGAFVALPC